MEGTYRAFKLRKRSLEEVEDEDHWQANQDLDWPTLHGQGEPQSTKPWGWRTQCVAQC